MSVIKVRIQKDFTILCNVVLEDPNLSFKAKGLWAYCMSRPDNWQFHVSHLATVSKDGVDAVYSALAELKEAGLVEYVQPNKGKFEKAEYVIYPYPQNFKISLPQRGFPDAGSSDAKNPALTSTDILPRTKKNPPPLSSKEDYILATPEEEEEIAKRLKERPKELPKIKHMSAWRKKVLKELRASSKEMAATLREIKLHHDQAKSFDMNRNSSGELICTYEEYVEFSCGNSVRRVYYNVSHEEWIQKTGWN